MKKLALIFCICGLVFGDGSALNSSNSQGSSSVPKITNIDLGGNLSKDSGCEADLPNDVFSGGVKICAIDENETDANSTMDGNFTANLDANLTVIEDNASGISQNLQTESSEEYLHKSNSGVIQIKDGGVKLPFD
ncbi:MAG: hypothetical protein J6U11_04140 [Campylobacter sp.]|nr:hypothetical protein [Campylobacter sp.]